MRCAIPKRRTSPARVAECTFVRIATTTFRRSRRRTSAAKRAEALRDACAHGTRKLDVLTGRTVLNLFFEPSTRTRTSFELAARRLGADVINFDIGFSSTSKGEELLDTLHTLEAMHLDAIIVRHKHSGTPDELVHHAMSGVSVINAGDGNRAHPTQGLLDALTIRQHRPDFEIHDA